MLPAAIELIVITPTVTHRWNEAGVAYGFMGMTPEDYHEMQGWIRSLAKNQREWQAYADFWERRAKELSATP